MNAADNPNAAPTRRLVTAGLGAFALGASLLAASAANAAPPHRDDPHQQQYRDDDRDHQKGKTYATKAPPSRKVVEQRPSRPNANAVWIDGYWRWNGHKHVWVGGHWDSHPKGKWVPGHWQKEANKGWLFIEGHWNIVVK